MKSRFFSDVAVNKLLSDDNHRISNMKVIKSGGKTYFQTGMIYINEKMIDWCCFLMAKKGISISITFDMKTEKHCIRIDGK